MNFEYETEIVELGEPLRVALALDRINLLGREGWELVGVIPISVEGTTDSIIAFLKRPIRNQ
jgi:hypothetical protein